MTSISQDNHQPHQDSTYRAMVPLAVANSLATILTFNLYIFWAKTNVRRYLWSTTRIGGDYLHYSGRGEQLAFGFALSFTLFVLLFLLPATVLLGSMNREIAGAIETANNDSTLAQVIVLMVVPVPLSLLALAAELAPPIEVPPALTAVCGLILVVGLFYFLTVSRFLTFRYMLRHTTWGAASGDIADSPWRYGWRLVGPELSRWVTLGWSGPWRYIKRYDVLLNAANVGAGKVRFTASSKSLYPRFALVWCFLVALMVLVNMIASAIEGHPLFDLLLGCLVVVGFLLTVVAVAWYNEQVYRTLARSIQIDDIEIRFHGTWHGLIRLYLTNLVMNLLSFGISYYFSRMRIARFIVRNLSFEGDTTQLMSSSSSRPEGNQREKYGEGFEVLLASSYF